MSLEFRQKFPNAGMVKPISGEAHRYYVQSRTQFEPWLVDTEEKVCACQEFYGRKVSGCFHLDLALEFEKENKI